MKISKLSLEINKTYPVLFVEGTLAQLDAVLLDGLGVQLLWAGSDGVGLQTGLDDLGLLFALLVGWRQLRTLAPVDDWLNHRWAAR